jgi:hypothetical protein
MRRQPSALEPDPHQNAEAVATSNHGSLPNERAAQVETVAGIEEPSLKGGCPSILYQRRSTVSLKRQASE